MDEALAAQILASVNLIRQEMSTGFQNVHLKVETGIECIRQEVMDHQTRCAGKFAKYDEHVTREITIEEQNKPKKNRREAVITALTIAALLSIIGGIWKFILTNPGALK